MPEKSEDPSDNKSVFSLLKTVFTSQDDANNFLKSQLDELQSKKEEEGKQPAGKNGKGKESKNKKKS